MKKRIVFQELLKRLQEPRKFIQVLLGPRQVGKTTLVLQASEAMDKPVHYASADLATLQDLSWLRQQWEVARQKVDPKKGALFILDEVQKIHGWSDVIKFLWDEDTRNRLNLWVVLLGSSPWLVQKGLSESLAGRFEMIPVTHWTFDEMHRFFGWNLDQYLYFGGYPGAVSLIDLENPTRWTNYINDSLIETTISRDVLLLSQVHKPVLLRRLFQLGCMYSGQILSYSKMLGQLQDAGNTTTLAHYLDLLAGAGLLAGIQKFAGQPARQKGSSPKFCVFNTALMSAQSGKSFKQAKEDPIFWGRLVESAVGAHLLNQIRGTQFELFYWREGDKEVDFILSHQNFLIALEVKSNADTLKDSGMDSFVKQFHPNKVLLIGEAGIPLEQFFTAPLMRWVE